ncbi:GTA-gp10 family protein [Sphingomonas sp. PAMC 26621]|uniref:GTA-gp10 family protein n=1 Tax=Sphingomonas sp. PAMC 26621 TaxID=1112213 RepID=UPI000289F8B6|nr:GTA-gp10 family protein [Sphingomonas sp. PAMC 26621]
MSDLDTAAFANADRGELSLILDGATMVLRPTFEALTEIEQTLDRGLVDLARDALAAKLKLAETAQIVTACVRAWGKEAGDKGASGANATRIARLIVDSEGGLHNALRTVGALLSLAVTGGYTASGELKPSTMTTTEKAPVDG